MTQTNQTYIEEKAQEIVEISQGHFVDYEWIDEDGTKGFSKAIPISFYKKWLRVALQDAIKYGEEENKDTQRLNFLDRMNEQLNQHYGTEYGWELILNHNVTRLLSGNINRIDLNDSKAHGAKSCRTVIDDAIAKLTTSQEEG